MTHPDLTSLEDRAYRTVVDDGVPDICFGLFILMMALVLQTEIHIFGEFDAPALLIVLIPVVWKVLRSQIIEPRVGYVQLHEDRRRKIRNWKMGALALFFFATIGANILTGIDASWADVLARSKALLIGAVLASPLVLAAVLFRVRRWGLIAALFLAGSVVEYTAGLMPGESYPVTGVITIAIGIRSMFSFLGGFPATGSSEAETAYE